MKYFQRSPALLVLQDGTIYYGKSAGKIGTTTGEICFNTGMTGYQEIFTDPSYFGQIMVATNVHIGNYGIKNGEEESDSIKIAGLVCRNFNITYSRKQANESILDYFLEQNLVAITDIDTRAIVRHIRDKGAMNAIISSEDLDPQSLLKKLKSVPTMDGLELSSKVTCKQPYFFGNSDSRYKVAVLDLGVKKNSLRGLNERECYVKVFPSNSDFNTIMSWKPDGILVSNGPGDPAAMHDVVKTVKDLINFNLPLMGICLGHQILALACGIRTYKMHTGHRGINHPVKNIITGYCEVTSQNHGFAINKEDVEAAVDRIEVTHINLNEGSIEGIRIKNKNAFSVQYHPEAAPGPNDSRYLFDEFINMVKVYADEKKSEPVIS
ncbi:MAG: glutamine-hydrolyzing carbamoyl-phosphate synthase small subunit [Bacteroidia bacterium]